MESGLVPNLDTDRPSFGVALVAVLASLLLSAWIVQNAVHLHKGGDVA